MKLILSISFTLLTYTLFSQFTLSNERSFGGSQNDGILKRFKVNNNYYFFGSSASNAGGDKGQNSFGMNDFWMVCTDLNNNILWDTIYGGSGNESLENVQFDGNNFYLIGRTNSLQDGNKTTPFYGDSDLWLLKLDLLGNILYQQSYGGDDIEYISTMTLIDNVIYISAVSESGVSGNKTTANFGSSDYWILKVNKNDGQIQTQKSFGTSGIELGIQRIIKTASNSLLFYSSALALADGNKTELGYGSTDIWLLELDPDLNILKEKCFGGIYEEQANDIIEKDGYYYLISTSSSHISGNKTSPSFSFLDGSNPNWFFSSDLWLLKLDVNFNLVWDKSYGGPGTESNGNIFYAEHDKLVLSCTSRSNANGAGNKTTPNYGQEDVWVVITDLDGNILTQQNFGGTGEDYGVVSPGNSPTELFLNVFTNSSASSIGNMSVVSNGGFDAWIADVDVQNWLTIAEENASKQIKVYPNPTTDFITLSQKVENLELYSAQGKLLSTKQQTDRLDLTLLPTGWYLIKTMNQDLVEFTKILKQ